MNYSRPAYIYIGTVVNNMWINDCLEFVSTSNDKTPLNDKHIIKRCFIMRG